LKKALPAPCRRILVSRTDKIGDLILSLPVFETLKASFPKAHLTALVSSYASEVVKDQPAVHQVVTLPHSWSVFRLAAEIRALKPDAFVALYPRPKIAWAAFLAKVPIRVGTAYRWYSFLFSRKVSVHRSVCDRHEAEYNLDLARALGARKIVKNLRFPLQKKHRLFAENYFRSSGVRPKDRVIVVHPGHRGSALNWSVERYAEAVEKMARWNGVRILLTGGREEKPLLSRLTGMLSKLPESKKPLVMAGECDLKELAALYERGACFLSGSTGTMHLAAAVGTPVVSLFCPVPTATPKRWGPWTKGKTAVLMPKNLTCPDCASGRCRQHDPMDSIPVEEVLRTVKRLGRW